MNVNDLVIRTQGLSKTYGEVDALKNLSLQVPQKTIFAFLGPNVAGKTTTIKLLLGLIRPTNGGGTVFGRDIVADTVDIRANVGYLPQDARFYEHMTARQVLDYTAKFFFKGSQKEIDKRVDEMLDLVGLADKASRPIKGFSGGERQRLGIAQAEVNYPDLLILDEPAASLDPQGRRDVLAVIVSSASGEVKIKETSDFDTKQGAIGGALAGGVLGLLSGGLIKGAILGAAGGAAAGKFVDLGLDDEFLKSVGDSLGPGSSAIVALVDFEQVDQAMAELDKFEGGRILKHSLSDDVYIKLSEAVED